MISKPQLKLINRVGLDIGSSSIKLMEVSGASGAQKITALGTKKIRDLSRQSLTNSIKSLTQEIKVNSSEAVLSVSGASVIVRFISMPRMSEKELKGAVRFEAEKFIPFDIKDCMIDFHILSRNERENKTDVVLALAKKDLVEQRVKAVEDAGFSVGVMDVDSFAVTNAFLKNFPSLESDNTCAIINVGASYTNLSLVKGGLLCFVRDIAIGGNEFNAAMARELGMDESGCEALKISPGQKAKGVKDSLKNILGNLIDEIRLSFSYYENQFGRNVGSIYLSGGSSRLVGLGDAFEDAFGLKPEIWDPLKFLDVSSMDVKKLEELRSSMAVAAGLMLR
ncbi:MAG: type IV pilus assembly protein PilM [Candidatus Omnitrophica bacterium]|nr:type IV pilus assembly protein PilM [Candidatus Omnitrophota bacterium]